MKPVARRYTSVGAEPEEPEEAEVGAEAEVEVEAEAVAVAEDSFLASKSLRAVNPMLTGVLGERKQSETGRQAGWAVPIVIKMGEGLGLY